MWIKRLILIILFYLPTFVMAAEEDFELKGGQLFTPEMVENIKKLVEDIPINDQELREIRDAANIWERDSANSQIELREAAALDMQSQQIDNVLDPTADQDAATKKYVDDNTGDMSYSDTRFKVGSFTRDISLTTDQPVTGVGFTPKGLAILYAVDTSLGIGASDTSTDGNVRIDGSPAATYNVFTNYIIYTQDNGNSARATVQSFDSDGFTLDWTDKVNTPTGTKTFIYVAWR